MKFAQVQQMSKDELQKKQRELELELIKEQGTIAAGTRPKNPGQVRQLKKTIAKIKQVLAQ